MHRCAACFFKCQAATAVLAGHTILNHIAATAGDVDRRTRVREPVPGIDIANVFTATCIACSFLLGSALLAVVFRLNRRNHCAGIRGVIANTFHF